MYKAGPRHHFRNVAEDALLERVSEPECSLFTWPRRRATEPTKWLRSNHYRLQQCRFTHVDWPCVLCLGFGQGLGNQAEGTVRRPTHAGCFCPERGCLVIALTFTACVRWARAGNCFTTGTR